MSTKVIKNLENFNFRGVEIPKQEKNCEEGVLKNLNFFEWIPPQINPPE